jgi:hypothetical protein
MSRTKDEHSAWQPNPTAGVIDPLQMMRVRATGKGCLKATAYPQPVAAWLSSPRPPDTESGEASKHIVSLY